MKSHGRFAGLAFAAALVTAAGAFASASGPLHAAGGDASPKTRSISVPHRDLNLATQAGVRQLEGRVRKAAKKLCVETGTPPLAAKTAARDCLKEAVASATPGVLVAVARHRKSEFASRAPVTE